LEAHAEPCKIQEARHTLYKPNTAQQWDMKTNIPRTNLNVNL